MRNFATSPNIQIMVVTVGAINKKDVNNLYKDSEKTGGERPIDLIRATRPILIVDEPQSVDGGLSGAGKSALGEMNPLCTLRYSATHADKHHMVFRLDAVDAYERKLVKQIEVASLEVEGGHNKAYVRFISASNGKGPVTARVEIDVLEGKQVRRKEVVVQDGDDLEELTKRAVYADCRIGEIRAARDNQFLEVKLPGSETFLQPGQAIGDVDADAMKRLMIRRTIHEHLEKEKRLAPPGHQGAEPILHRRGRALPAVRRRRQPGEGQIRPYVRGGVSPRGEAPRSSSACSRKSTWRPRPRRFTTATSRSTRRGAGPTRPRTTRQSRDNAERAYNLIMKDKEKLLSFETKLKFIFSHSALKEGWDNPNVFQICALREMGTERERRQTIGRGLRLCVNQQGRTPARLRGQHADRRRHRKLRAVRREPAEGDREGYRHPLRHRREAPVRRHPGRQGRRLNRNARLRRV